MEGVKHLFEGNDYVFTQEKVDSDRRVGTYMGRTLSKGSIYRAFVPFDSDSSKYKLRPVILLGDSLSTSNKIDVLICTTAITEKLNKSIEKEYKVYQIPKPKYPILNWKNNGFDIPAYVVISKNRNTNDYYVSIEKKYVLEPIYARNYNNYNEFLMDSSQYEEILEYLNSVKHNNLSPKNSKADPKSKYFDWKTMQIPEFAWKAYRKEFLDKDKEEKEVKALQKEEKLKQDFKNLRLYYLYDKDSKSVGDMSYSEKIFKDNRPRRCKKTKDWTTYESYMGKYFSVIDSIQDEINPKYKDMLPTKKEVMELKEHILSDEELRIFLEESI